MKNGEPDISVIIPVKNEESTIEKCINSLLNLNYPPDLLEIIIINDASTDETGKILDKFKNRITLFKTPGLGPSEARNLGLEHARGDYVAFTDADCLVDREWINQLLPGFQSEKVAGVGGDQKTPIDETYFGRMVMDFFKSLGFLEGYTKSARISQIQEVDHNPSCNVIYRKIIIKNIGGFHPGLWPGEDVDLDYRLKKIGYKLNYSPTAIVYHYQPSHLIAFSRKIALYGKWSGGFLTRKYGFFRRLSFEPVLLACSFFLVIAAFLLFPPLGYPLLAIGLFFPLVFLLFQTRELKKASILWLLLLTTIIFWNLGFLRGWNAKIHS